VANHADVWSVLDANFNKYALTYPASGGDALSVQTVARFQIRLTCFWLGFLPVLYTCLRTKYQTAPVFLPSDPDEDESPSSKPNASSEDLTGWKVLFLWFPAACDLAGTTVRNLFLLSIKHILCAVLIPPPQLMNVGLLYTPVSIFQMSRGALVLFVGILSVIFLRRRLWLYQFVFTILLRHTG